MLKRLAFGRKLQVFRGKLSVFLLVVALTGFGMGLSDSLVSNFFKDAYQVSAVQRGFLEFPRELPGLLCFLVIALCSSLGDVRLAVVSQLLYAVGIAALGLFTPAYAWMLAFLFLNSMGMHIYIPLQDSIGMSLVEGRDVGGFMGKYNSVRTAFLMLASVLVFFGFRSGVFSFHTQFKLPFVIAAAVFVCIAALYILLYTKYKVHGAGGRKKIRFILKKEYKFYYILATLHGAQKQIMIVFGPWVLIELLGKQADTTAMLGIVASFLGIFLLPLVGRWMDRLGVHRIMLAEGIVFVGVYIGYGLLSAGFSLGRLALAGVPVFAAFALFVVDRLTMQFAMVRIAYLKSIVTDPGDVTPTLSTGISLDHIVSITCAYLGGLAWNAYGPQYVFFVAAGLSLVNIVVALIISPRKK